MRLGEKKFLRRLVCMMMGLWICGLAQAADRSFELWSGALADFSMNTDTKKMYGGFLGTRPTIAPSFSYFIRENLALSLSPAFNFHTAGNYYGRIMAGVIYHAGGESSSSSFFFKLFFGFDDIFDNRTSDQVHFTLKTVAWQFAAGKKFQIYSGVSYAPEIDFLIVMEKFAPLHSLSFIPLQFTVLF